MTKKPNTFVVTLRCDIRSAATIHLMLKDSDIHTSNPSALASEAMNLLGELAKAKGFDTFKSTASALSYLQSEGVLGDTSKLRNYNTLVKQLQAENTQTETAETIAHTPIPAPTEATESIEDQVQRRLREQQQVIKAFQNAPSGLISEEDD